MAEVKDLTGPGGRAPKKESTDINSMTKMIERQHQETKQHLASVTKSISSVSKQQDKIKETYDKNLKVREIGYSKGIKEVDKSVQKIMGKMLIRSYSRLQLPYL